MLAFTPGPFELAIVAGIILLLFGNRLPSVMRNMGKGITEFKKGVNSIEDQTDNSDDRDDKDTKDA